MLILHQDTCINSFIAKYPAAPNIVLNWAFYIPEAPLSEFGLTGNLAVIGEKHLSIIRESSGIDRIENDIILPHDMVLKRMYENRHVKSISRLSCFGRLNLLPLFMIICSCLFCLLCILGGFKSEHCPEFKASARCTLTSKVTDPENHFFSE